MISLVQASVSEPERATYGRTSSHPCPRHLLCDLGSRDFGLQLLQQERKIKTGPIEYRRRYIRRRAVSAAVQQLDLARCRAACRSVALTSPRSKPRPGLTDPLPPEGCAVRLTVTLGGGLSSGWLYVCSPSPCSGDRVTLGEILDRTRVFSTAVDGGEQKRTGVGSPGRRRSRRLGH